MTENFAGNNELAQMLNRKVALKMERSAFKWEILSL